MGERALTVLMEITNLKLSLWKQSLQNLNRRLPKVVLRACGITGLVSGEPHPINTNDKPGSILTKEDAYEAVKAKKE